MMFIAPRLTQILLRIALILAVAGLSVAPAYARAFIDPVRTQQKMDDMEDNARRHIEAIIQQQGGLATPKTRQRVVQRLLLELNLISSAQVPGIRIGDAGVVGELGYARHEQLRSWPAISVLRCDEILRRFEYKSDPIYKELVAYALLTKAHHIMTEGYWRKNDSGLWVPWHAPKAALPIYEKIISRFGRDKNPEIRLIYVIADLWKRRVWESSDPQKAIALYDEFVKRHAKDSSPAVRWQAMLALYFKKNLIVWQQPMTDLTSEEAFRWYATLLLFHKANLSRWPGPGIDDETLAGIAKNIHNTPQKEAMNAIKDDCLQRDVPALRAIASGSLQDFLRQCEKNKNAPSALNAFYDEIEYYFGHEQNAEVQRFAIIQLLQRSFDDMDEQLAFYESIFRRFGNNLAIRWEILDKLNRPKNAYYREAALRWFSGDKSDYALNILVNMTIAKAQELSAQGDITGALAVYDEGDRRFSDRYDTIYLLSLKANLLQSYKDLVGANAVYDEIVRRFDKIYAAFRDPMRRFDLPLYNPDNCAFVTAALYQKKENLKKLGKFGEAPMSQFDYGELSFSANERRESMPCSNSYKKD